MAVMVPIVSVLDLGAVDIVDFDFKAVGIFPGIVNRIKIAQGTISRTGLRHRA
jgi:hypothetical protein